MSKIRPNFRNLNHDNNNHTSIAFTKLGYDMRKARENAEQEIDENNIEEEQEIDENNIEEEQEPQLILHIDNKILQIRLSRIKLFVSLLLSFIIIVLASRFLSQQGTFNVGMIIGCALVLINKKSK